ncbi:hypothetical protein FA95DRAFT_1025025 [Auriscalpium vulgare]|uniref:Uncharacterized protein n=1 Tax=Auriscalpium vulgare TaxID=40419 RepID=A0ACB8RX39_9AGAM|nr:hypothetical protein FA95DRAFT_1025025 [Auriscalpium vulgare]
MCLVYAPNRVKWRATGIHGLLTFCRRGARCVVSRAHPCAAPSPNVARQRAAALTRSPYGPARHCTHVGGGHHASVTQARARVPPPSVLGKSHSAIPPPALTARRMQDSGPCARFVSSCLPLRAVSPCIGAR